MEREAKMETVAGSECGEGSEIEAAMESGRAKVKLPSHHESGNRSPYFLRETPQLQLR
jgi:hypothetical protein